MSDRFSSHAPSLTGPASSGFAVTPNDDADLGEATRALFVGTGGMLTVTMVSGAILTFDAVADSALLPLRVSRIHQTGTTAGNIIGLV